MKNISLYITALLLLVLSACATTGDTVGTDLNDRREPGTQVMTNPNTLADILIRLPGVIVDEAGLGTRVSVRGAAPLYVIDGVRVGRSYQSAAMALNVNDIASVEVLKNPTETMMYGRDGAFGVIVIRTRRG